MSGADVAMRSTDASDGYEAALVELLPGRVQQQLLVACLSERDVAAPAWRDFAAAVGDAKAFFEADQSGLKGLLPFVAAQLMANSIDPGKEFSTYVRVALVREELRAKIYGEILAAVLGALDAAQIATLLLKGGAVSETVYPQPSARHNHAIDLLVDERQLDAAGEVLRSQRCEAQPRGAGAGVHHVYKHWTGLALALHTRPFYFPHFEMSAREIRARARSVEIGSITVRVLSPEDSLVHIAGHAMYSRGRTNLRWACDAFFLIQSSKAMDWQYIIGCADRARTALPLYVQLRWLKDALGASIPAAVLTTLRERSRAIDGVSREGILAALVHTHMSWRRAAESCRRNPLMMVRLLRYGVTPSLRYLRWRYNHQHDWQLPFAYLRRPAQFAMQVVKRHLVRVAPRDVDGLNPLRSKA